MLKEIINNYFSEQIDSKKQSKFYISDAGKCQRMIFFKFKNAPSKTAEPRILRLFEHGDYIHQMIMRALLATREVYVVASEVSIPPTVDISGRADAVISDGKDLYILDIKSISSAGFRLLRGPKQEHINQLQLYLHFLDPKKGILLYINKDNDELKEYFIDYDKDLAESLISQFQQTKEKIEKNIIPQRCSDWPSGWQCRYCDFYEICKLAGNGEMDWEEFKTQVNSLSNSDNFS